MRLFLYPISSRDNARIERSAGQQLEPDFLTASVEYRFPAAQDNRTNGEQEFIDQAELKQRLRRSWAAEDNKIFARLFLEYLDFLCDIVLDQHRIVPIHFVHRPGNDDLLHILQPLVGFF